MSDETPAERVSRFREHTNTNSSIRPPPDELWKGLGIDMLIDKFNDENDGTPAVRKASHPRQMMAPTGARTGTAAARKGSDAAATVATAEGTFGRFSRVFANVFGGVLGKRKAGHPDAEPAVDAEQAQLDERKRQAEEAYHLAKEQGLLPAPKVFVRPGMPPRAWSADTPSRPRPRPPLTPRTPGSVVRSASKKDLNKQKKLSKRVSSLEGKLASAKKELQSVLGNECFPAVPPFPQHIVATGTHATVSPTPNTPHVFSDDGAPLSPTGGFGDGASASLPGKITKKRKSVALVDAGSDYLPTATAIASDVEMSEAEPEPEPATAVSPEPERQRTIKRVKSDASKRLKRTSSRLSRKVSRSSVREEREERVEKVVVVKPGGAVPPVPAVPSGVEGNKVKVVGDDGYGGLGHEIF
ncbi:hypothetical protein BU25DRAFT_435815 [Macroventuria anomochaeta]|uniref:Uncharacterized protein n=1 Tax=Macroventuria anomochaeta TaxID=301207 RepID=A0ACB6SGA3_9PLEO|nr:uncharacterized protein BU25DRAFT_435815 [Macroventuria anomochaeta]KAF2633256.1 hypothetical protein BU25DRAFT_435815 [Macroventuria anomochaeta]